MNRQRNRPSVFPKIPGRANSSRFSNFVSSFLGFILIASSPAFGDTQDATVPPVDMPDDMNEVPAKAIAPPPVGVRFGEPLEGEHFRISYQYERVQKQGLLVSDEHVRPGELFDNVAPSPVYIRVPRSLAITVHTFQLAYAPHPRVTLVAELPFLQKELETLAATGIRSEVQTQGVGDLGFAVVLPFIRKGNESSHIHFGFDVPTGSIRRGGDVTRLPYDSQIGNGTVDLEWGWTYRGFMDELSWGGQVVGRHPVGRNDLDYREGSRFEASFWGAFQLLEGLSASLRMNWEKRNNIRLRRRVSNAPLLDVSDNAKARGGTTLTISPGLTLEIPQLGNQRISVEVGIPFHQDLDGPQLEEDWSVKAGWQWGF